MLAYSDKSEIEDDLISLLGENYDDSDIVEFGDLDKLLLTAMIKTISTAEIQVLIQETENYIDEHFNSEESNIQISGISVFINDFVNIIVQSSITSILFKTFIKNWILKNGSKIRLAQIFWLNLI